jgi:hypothetical protein
MLYQGSNTSLLWQPRPDFYYLYYTQKFTGDYAITATSTNANILAYASRFASGETGVVIVNRSETAQVVKINPTDLGVGNQYYTYSLTGGTDNGDFSLYVSVNGVGPTGTQWGPRASLATIPANAYAIDNNIAINSPGLSVQFIMVDAGTNIVSVSPEIKNQFAVTNYPNPFSAITAIQFQTSTNTSVSLDVFNQTGKKVTSLVNGVLPLGTHSFDFDGSMLPGGMYYYQLKIGNDSTTRKMILVK